MGEPTSQTRPRSFLSKSTIIKFSALAFGDESRADLDCWSRIGSAYRRAVPLMGRASTQPSLSPFKKRSGEEQQICRPKSSLFSYFICGLWITHAESPTTNWRCLHI